MRIRRQLWILPLLMALSLPAAAPGQISLEPGSLNKVAGHVSAVHPSQRTFELGSTVFHVPTHIQEFKQVAPGTFAVIQFEESGGQKVVTELELGGDPD